MFLSKREFSLMWLLNLIPCSLFRVYRIASQMAGGRRFPYYPSVGKLVIPSMTVAGLGFQEQPIWRPIGWRRKGV